MELSNTAMCNNKMVRIYIHIMLYDLRHSCDRDLICNRQNKCGFKLTLNLKLEIGIWQFLEQCSYYDPSLKQLMSSMIYNI